MYPAYQISPKWLSKMFISFDFCIVFVYNILYGDCFNADFAAVGSTRRMFWQRNIVVFTTSIKRFKNVNDNKKSAENDATKMQALARAATIAFPASIGGDLGI